MDNESNTAWKDAYINIDNRYTRLPNNFIYENVMLDNYNVSNIDDSYICAELPMLDLESGRKVVDICPQRIKYNDTRIVVKLLNLRKQLSDDLFERFAPIEQLISAQGVRISNTSYANTQRGHHKQYIFKKQSNIDTTINNQDVDSIISWCKRNGYPFSYTIYDRFRSPEYKKSYFIDENGQKHVQYYTTMSIYQKFLKPTVEFSCWDFLLHLHIFYLSCVFFDKITNAEYKLSDKDVKGYTNKQCERLLNNIYNRIRVKIKLDFTNTNKAPISELISYSADNIFDFALYSLFLFRTLSSQEMKQCLICNNYFIPTTKKQKYCRVKPCEIGKCDDYLNEPPCNKDYCNKRTCYPQLKHKRKILAENKKNK